MDRPDLLQPISEADPCGPDLDLEGDSDFLSYLAFVEGQLPGSFFSFDPKSIDFDKVMAEGVAFLERSRDVRVVVALAKLAILRRDLPGFAGWIHALRDLMVERWDEVNPRSMDGDFSLRMAPIYTFDDLPVVIFPLQHTPIVPASRDGPIAYRQHLLASGEVKPREKENVLEASAVERALMDAPLEQLVEVRTLLQGLRTDLADIRSVSTDRAGFEQAVKLEVLPKVIDDLLAFVEAPLARRDPAAVEAPPEAGAEAAEPDGAPAAALPAGRIASRAAADAALAAALAYFEKNEPSSPAVLLVRQARQLLGRNLYEVLQILLPAHVDAARVQIGAEPAFTVPINAMGSSDEFSAGEEEQPVAETRAAALALLDQVATFIRATEPTSPVPLLIDRTKLLGSRDFLSLLKDLLPDDVLATFRHSE